LNSLNSQPNDSHDKSDSIGETHGKTKWSITPEAFDKLLNAFARDREEAGRLYEQARTKLIRFFEWHSITPGDYYADETLNRVARRLDEGQKVDNLMAYIFGVARMVLREALKELHDRGAIPLNDTREIEHMRQPDPVEPDEREECFDRCLDRLLPGNRSLILEYYQEDRRAKIQLRQRIADRLCIPLNALRIRAHRIRTGLEKCITDCMESRHRRNN
jgi:DNA-directed RNA polymerase specialized sigma24 family protein